MPIVRDLITRLSFDINERQLRRFDKQLGRTMLRMQKMTRNMTALSRKVRDFGRDLTFSVSAPLAGVSVFSLKATSDIEQMNVAFTTMLNSSERAQQFTRELLRFAEDTSFGIKEVFQASKQLLAVGIEDAEVINTMKALGDVAAGLSVPLSRVILNFGQVRAIGKLTGRELRDFTTAGIPIREQLAKDLGVTVGRVAELVSKGKVSFKDVETAFKNMSGEGGRFFNLTQKQAKTLGGRWEKLLDVLFSFRAEFGKLLEETLNIKGVLIFLAELFRDMTKALRDLSPFARKFIGWFTLLAIIVPPVIFALGALAPVIFAVVSALKLFGIALGPFLLLGVKIALVAAALFLFLDDLSTWVSGGESLIGKFLGNFDTFREKTIGMVMDIRDAFKAFFKGDFDGFIAALEAFNEKVVSIVKGIVDRLESIFNTQGASALRFILGSTKRGIETGAEAIGDFLGTNRLPGQGSGAKDLLDRFLPRAPAPRAAGGQTNINVQSKVEMAVPAGTSEEQRRFINEDGRAMVREELSRQFSGTINANPVTE